MKQIAALILTGCLSAGLLSGCGAQIAPAEEALPELSLIHI